MTTATHGLTLVDDAAPGPAPGLATSLRQQAGLLGISARWAYLALAMLGVLMVLASVPLPPDVPILLLVAPVSLPFGAFWAMAVWHGEGPDRKAYHWSLPVARPGHDLARVLAGIPYLLLAYVILAAGAGVVAAANGGFDRFAAIRGDAWAAYFAGPVVVYTLSMPLVLWRDYRIVRYGLAGMVALGFVAMIQAAIWDRLDVANFIDALFFHDRWGLSGALGNGILHEWLTGSGRIPLDNQIEPWRPAALLWLALGAAATAFAATFRPDDLRRLAGQVAGRLPRRARDATPTRPPSARRTG